MPMKVLIVGGGGREHALAWKAAQSALVSEVLVAPGNAGSGAEPKTRNLAIAADDVPALLALAKRERVDLTIVGPEQALVAGLVDAFEAEGLRCFGPTARAAQLEGSKLFAKEFLERHRIPTASYASFRDLARAQAHLRSCQYPLVIKADGLAAGKGVIIAETPAQADAALVAMLTAKEFGAAGSTVVIEEFLRGEEASFIAMVDGETVLPLASSQDHKRRDDGDQGPNTGGMGAYSPAPVVSPDVHDRVMRDIMLPTVRGLLAEGIHYRGFLYAGLMIDAAGQARVLEFNCRFGDPETQPILARLASDLVALCLHGVEGTLEQAELAWDARPAVGVVMASAGYPGPYRTGAVIQGLPSSEQADVKVFHAGTRLLDGQVVTHGGRVLCVVGLGENISAARERAYATVRQIHWDGAFYRQDIGYRALKRDGAP
jgi:phosphoribosylamine--glycine ligase